MISSDQKEALRHFQSNPELFFEKILGIDSLEEYQRRILKAIVDGDRVAISACHDVGKSWTLARVVLWYVTCFPYSKVITTAPTFNQVKNILWSEIRSAYSKSKFPLGGKMNLTEWQVTKEGDWFAIGFTPRNELSSEQGQGSASSFQGFHAPYILIVFDEATGIPNPIWTMAEGMLTSGNVKFVAIGNPTSRNSDFYSCFSSPDWTKVSLSCFDSPNLIKNGITDIWELKNEIARVQSLPEVEAQMRLRSYKIVKDYLLSLRWVVSMGLPRKWGVDHPLFQSKVLGKFPRDSDDTLIPLYSVEDAQLRVSYPTAGDRRTLGVDVARFGADQTVFTVLHGKKHLQTRAYFQKDTTEIVGEIIAMQSEKEWFDAIVIDETGVGGGVVDLLSEAKRDRRIDYRTDIRGVQFGASCESDEDREKFVNMKARMFRLLSDDLKAADGLTLPSGPDGDIYLDELPTILFKYDSKGRMMIESKDDYKRRTGRRSPDHADSLALANFGRYDELSAGKFSEVYTEGFSKPFASSLGGERKW